MSSRPAGARPRSCAARSDAATRSSCQRLRALHQHHGRLVAVLGLAAHVAHGLVQQDGDLLALLAARLGIDLDARVGPHLQAHRRDGAVDLDPALGDPVVGLAARAQAEFGHALVQAGGGGGAECGGCAQACGRGLGSALVRSACRSSTRRPPYSTSDDALLLQRRQRLVHALARQPHQVGQFLLRDAQHLADAGEQHRVEQRGQVARHAQVGVVHAVDLARGDELRQPLVQLVHHEAVEADGVVQQPVEGVDRQAGHHAAAQRLDVVAVDLALEHRAFAEPAARRQAAEGDGLALRVVGAHLQQALDHAEPVGDRPADAADVVARQRIAHRDVAAPPRARSSGCSTPSQGMPASSLRAWARRAALVQGRVRRPWRSLHAGKPYEGYP